MATTKTQPHTIDTSILINPRITEKAANASAFNTYLFDVAVGATKSEIAKAFFALYKHKPIKVNTVNVSRKSYFRKGRLSFGTNTKKAYVIVPKGTTIEIM
jgi:large subunit ribosomal protein L23